MLWLASSAPSAASSAVSPCVSALSAPASAASTPRASVGEPAPSSPWPSGLIRVLVHAPEVGSEGGHAFFLLAAHLPRAEVKLRGAVVDGHAAHVALHEHGIGALVLLGADGASGTAGGRQALDGVEEV